MASKNNGNFKFKGKQILLLGLVALVISAGYYRWTVESENLEKAVQTASETLPAAGDNKNNSEEVSEKNNNDKENKAAEKNNKDDKNNKNNKEEKGEKGENSQENQNSDSDKQSEDISKMRRDRDSARSASLEEWKKIQGDDKTGSESRKDAENKIKQQTEAADAERKIENQVKAKGYDDCFAYISENGISVTVKGGEVDGSKVAAIKDIIVTETGISVKNIKINSL